MAQRGRPRTYDKDLEGDVIRNKDITVRSANNYFNRLTAMGEIEKCSEATQRFFFGGRTLREAVEGKPKLYCHRNFVMQELGRHPRDQIPEIANAIAKHMNAWTQKKIVDFLKSKRLELKAKKKEAVYDSLISLL